MCPLKSSCSLVFYWGVHEPSSVFCNEHKRAVLRKHAHSILHRDFFSGEKIENFIGKKFDIFSIMLKTLIMGTLGNCLGEVVLMSTHNLCFRLKMRKIGITLYTPVLLYKSGVHGGMHYMDVFS